MVTSANDDPALVAKQLNTRPGCAALGAMMGRYRIEGSVLVCVLQKAAVEKRPRGAGPAIGRARRRRAGGEEPAFEVPDQVGRISRQHQPSAYSSSSFRSAGFPS
jgi:hypothetical protein